MDNVVTIDGAISLVIMGGKIMLDVSESNGRAKPDIVIAGVDGIAITVTMGDSFVGVRGNADKALSVPCCKSLRQRSTWYHDVAVGNWSLDVTRWPLLVGRYSLVAAHWPLVAGRARSGVVT